MPHGVNLNTFLGRLIQSRKPFLYQLLSVFRHSFHLISCDTLVHSSRDPIFFVLFCRMIFVYKWSLTIQSVLIIVPERDRDGKPIFSYPYL